MKLRVVIPVFLIVISGALLVAPGFVDWGQYRTEIQSNIAQHSGYQVDLNGDIELAILPSPRVIIEDVVVHSQISNDAVPLLSLERLDVHVALLPLLKKQVQVRSIRLVQPDIYLKISKGGVPNWLVPTAIDANKNQEGQGVKSVSIAQSSAASALSFEDIKVYGGSLRFDDEAKGKEVQFEKLDLSIAAKTLLGPYKVTGEAVYQERLISFDASAEGYDPVGKSIAPHVKLMLSPGDVAIEYSGFISLANGVDVQGEVALKTLNLAKTAPFLQNRNLLGKLSIPLNLSGFLSFAKDNFELKDLSVGLGKNNLSGYIGGGVSKNIFDLNIKMSGEVEAKNELVPVSTDMSLKFFKALGDISVGKSKVKLGDMAVQLSGGYKAAKEGRRALVQVEVQGRAIDLDDLKSKFEKGGTPTNKKSVENAAAKSAKAIDVKALVSPLVMPFDLDFDISVDELTSNALKMAGVRLKGGVRGDAIAFENASVQDVLSSSFSLSGGVKSLAEMSGINVLAAIKTPDARALGKYFGVDTKALPSGLKAADVSVSLKGNIENLATITNIKALGAEIVAQATFDGGASAANIKRVGVRLKHPDMGRLVRVFSPDASSNAALSNPIDIYSDISLGVKHYELSNIKGRMFGTALSGELALDMKSLVPNVRGDLQLGDLRLAGISKKNAPRVSGAAQKVDKQGKGGGNSSSRWSNAALNLDWMSAFNGDIKVDLKSLQHGKWNLLEPVLNFKLQDGNLSVTKLDAGVFGGNVHLTAKAQKKDDGSLSASSNVQLRGVNLARLTEALSPRLPIKIDGVIASDIKLESFGKSQADLISVLGGSGELSGENLVLHGADLTQFARALSSETKIGDSVMGLWEGASNKGGTTAFDVLSGSFAIDKGIVSIAEMDLDGAKALVETTGQVNLPRWTLSTKHKITLKDGKDIPPVEMSFSGSLDNPGQTFAKGALDDFISRKINRKLEQLLTDKLGLDPFQKQRPAPSPSVPPSNTEAPQQQSGELAPPVVNQPEQVTPEDALRGLLEGLISF